MTVATKRVARIVTATGTATSDTGTSDRDITAKLPRNEHTENARRKSAEHTLVTI